MVFRILAGCDALKVTSRTSKETNLVYRNENLILNQAWARLSGVLRFDVCHFFGASLKSVCDSKQGKLALARSGLRPGFKGFVGNFVGSIDIGSVAQLSGCIRLAGGWVEDLAGLARLGLYILAVDEVL